MTQYALRIFCLRNSSLICFHLPLALLRLHCNSISAFPPTVFKFFTVNTRILLPFNLLRISIQFSPDGAFLSASNIIITVCHFPMIYFRQPSCNLASPEIPLAFLLSTHFSHLFAFYLLTPFSQFQFPLLVLPSASWLLYHLLYTFFPWIFGVVQHVQDYRELWFLTGTYLF